MQIHFKINPSQSKLTASVKALRTEIKAPAFYLNRDFKLLSFKSDGVTQLMKTTLTIHASNPDYTVMQYILPHFEETIEFTYEGYLSGETGTCPYVKETISESFTLLRFETFCYPLFLEEDAEALLHLLTDSQLNLQLILTVPSSYTICCTGHLKNRTIESDTKQEIYQVNNPNFAIAISPYIQQTLPMGYFYFLEEPSNLLQLKEAMSEAYHYMNTHFGERQIHSSTPYVTIPDGFGSFVLDEMVFIQASTYKDLKELRQIIHEFIHLGWNAKTDLKTQRIRFFDEAFTSYFEHRVMTHLLPKQESISLLTARQTGYTRSKNHLTKDIPISEFGTYEYGGLSYTLGVFFFIELCEFLGEELFDQIMTEFLFRYQNEQATLESFCQTYINLAQKDGLSDFLNQWLYTTNPYKKYSF